MSKAQQLDLGIGVEDIDMDDLLNAANGTDQETVETESQKYPIIQWVNGKGTLKKSGGVPYTGGWFISSDNIGEVKELPGWEADELITRNNQSIPGFFKRDILVSILHIRKRWRVQGDGEQATTFPWNMYDEAKAVSPNGKNPSGNVQIMVWLKDLDIYNPFVLTCKGFVGAEMTGNRTKEGVFGAFSHRVIGTINNALRNKTPQGEKPKILPWRAFWCNVGPQREADGTPKYVTVGSGTQTSSISLPALIGVTQHPVAIEVASLFVGAPLLDRLNLLWGDPSSTAWQEAWNHLREEKESVTKEPDTTPAIVSGDLDGGGGVADLGEDITF